MADNHMLFYYDKIGDVMTAFTIILLFFSFLIILTIGLAWYEVINDNDVPDWVREDDK
jgi:preprotein translocase subunit SecG